MNVSKFQIIAVDKNLGLVSLYAGVQLGFKFREQAHANYLVLA